MRVHLARVIEAIGEAIVKLAYRLDKGDDLDRVYPGQH